MLTRMITYTSTFSGYSILDVETTKTFYESMLGIPVKQTAEGLELHSTGGNAVFLYPKKDHVPATFTVLNFLVTDIDTAAEELKTAGIKLENYDVPSMIADEKGIYRGLAAGYGPDIAWFKDPSGNILSIIQDK